MENNTKEKIKILVPLILKWFSLFLSCFNAILFLWSSQNGELFATPPDVGGEEKEIIYYAGSGLQTCLKRLKNLLET